MAENNQDEYQEFGENYRQIRRDVRFVAITNFLILGALVGAYFLNQKYGFIDLLLKRF